MKKHIVLSLLLVSVIGCSAGCAGKDKGDSGVAIVDEVVESSTSEVNVESVQSTVSESDIKVPTDAPVSEDVAFNYSVEDFVNDPFMVVNGVPLELPCHFSELEALGFQWDTEHYAYEELTGTKVAPDTKTKEAISIINDNYDNDLMYTIHTRNLSSSEVLFEDTSVYRFTVDASKGASDITKLRPDVALSCGITWEMTADEVKSILGEPDDVFTCVDYDKYTYIYENFEAALQIGTESGVNKISLHIY